MAAVAHYPEGSLSQHKAMLAQRAALHCFMRGGVLCVAPATSGGDVLHFTYVD
jgi:hypothetical protein